MHTSFMQIDMRGYKRRGLVTSFSYRTGRHEVEWEDSQATKVTRSTRGSRAVEVTSWVDFSAEEVISCIA